ncbi:helix-turn-helix transcriptional regulator [Planobispora rosea]|uniref:helix-turn-helix transcriptional regulator n=1 Tax=Planobispora rosea TaxID=35762 RepID=UPI002457B66D|nr:LuxR family transcriptional regulator [Planobispora rosea]
MLHRAAELTIVNTAMTRLRSGTPAVIVVRGDRGIGKTAFLSAAVARAPSSAVVLRARGHPSERTSAFGVVRQLFDGLPAPAPPASAGFPAPDEALHQLYRQARSLTSGRPVVIAIDDVTLADPESAQWCSYIARRLDELPVTMIVTLDVGGSDLDDLAQDIGALPYGHLLRLEPLCPDCCAELLATAFGTSVHPGFALACHRLTGGNPFLLGELANSLRAARVAPDETNEGLVDEVGAVSLTATVLNWLSSSHPEAVDLIKSLTVLGPEIGLAAAATLAGHGEAAAAEAVTALRRARLLGDADDFAHPAIRRAVLAGTDAQRLGDLHIRAADLLLRLGAPPHVCAEHVMSAGPRQGPDSVGILREAATEAAAHALWPEADRYLRRALSESVGLDPPLGLLSELGAVELHLDIPAARRHLRTVSERAGTPDALLPFADVLLTVNAPESVDAFAAWLDVEPRFAAQTLLAGRPVPAARLTGPGRDLAAVTALATAAAGGLASRTEILARRCLDIPGSAPATLLAALALSWAERFDDAAYWADRAMADIQATSSPVERAFALVVSAELAYRAGRLETSAATAAAAVEPATAASAGELRVAAESLQARVLVEHDDVTAAARRLAGLNRLRAAHPLIRALQLEVTGLIQLTANQNRQALYAFAECGRHALAAGVSNPACLAWRGHAALAHAKLGEVEQARRLADEELRLARSWRRPAAIGRALSVAGVTREDTARVDLLREAVEVLRGSGARLDEARAVVRLGITLRQRGETAKARQALIEGVTLATECDATRLARLAHDNLLAAGGRTAARRGDAPRAYPVTTVRQSLTSGEQRVAQLVIQGMGNQAVADHLSISKRTVDTHLARIFRKLGIRARSELGPALNGNGATGVN